MLDKSIQRALMVVKQMDLHHPMVHDLGLEVILNSWEFSVQ
jgi:hypothetical protein